MGENPIKEKIRLKRDTYSYYFLELQKDGTAFYIDVDYDDDNTSNKEEIETTYKYSYDDEEKTITMIVEKVYYRGFFGEEEGQLLTYNEYLSKLDEDFTEKNMKYSIKEEYARNKDKEGFKEKHPDCNSYEDYEKEILEGIKADGFDSLDAYAKDMKRFYENACKSMFGAQITYAYKITDGKITLTEKFTGVKNLLNSRCRFSGGSNYASIRCSSASIDYHNDGSYSYYYGDVNTDKKTISFESEDQDENGNREKVNATYEENIPEETVTIKFKGEEYVCKFEADKYIQE